MDVGGQAVMEGVMMRNKERFAVAVRLPNGKIKVMKERNTPLPAWCQVFFIRGIIGLGYLLYDGIRALIWSGNQISDEKEQMSSWQIVLTLLVSLGLSVVVFVLVPFLLARYLGGQGVLFDVLDGVFRVGLFVGYLAVISMMDDVKRLFAYHGAEHKTIACYEAGEKLTVGNVKKYSRFHPRCGTTFMFFMVLLSIFVFTLINGAWWVELLGRIILLPVISGVGYELIKLSGRCSTNPLVRVLVAPGLWLQRLTTREPDEKQIEVGIKSLQAVVK